MSTEKSHEEVSLLIQIWFGATEPCDPRAVFLFNVTLCTLVRWKQATVNTPAGRVTRIAVVIEGHIGGAKPARLYLVDWEDVQPFYEALCNVKDGAIPTANVTIAVKPLVLRDHVNPDGSAVSVMLGRQPEVGMLLEQLREYEPTR